MSLRGRPRPGWRRVEDPPDFLQEIFGGEGLFCFSSVAMTASPMLVRAVENRSSDSYNAPPTPAIIAPTPTKEKDPNRHRDLLDGEELLRRKEEVQAQDNGKPNVSSPQFRPAQMALRATAARKN